VTGSHGRDDRLHDAGKDPPAPIASSGRWKETEAERRDPLVTFALVAGIGLPVAAVLWMVAGFFLG
jgi:hypothetical protein